MLREIHTHGPIVVAIDVPDELRFYQSDVFSSSPERRLEHTQNRKQSSWEFTSHAVAVVGWGESAERKYWIVRNSWGPQFGMNGYVRYQRGINDGGVEAQAVWITPDMDRLQEHTDNFTNFPL